MAKTTKADRTRSAHLRSSNAVHKLLSELKRIARAAHMDLQVTFDISSARGWWTGSVSCESQSILVPAVHRHKLPAVLDTVVAGMHTAIDAQIKYHTAELAELTRAKRQLLAHCPLTKSARRGA